MAMPTRLKALRRVFGGHIRNARGRAWLDTRVDGLRAVVIRRATPIARIAFEVAVFTPETDEVDPFISRIPGGYWYLYTRWNVLPRLRHGFVFQGCRHGVLIATSTRTPSLDDVTSTLRELAAWARTPWSSIPRAPDDDWLVDERRARRERWNRASWAVLVAALVWYVRATL